MFQEWLNEYNEIINKGENMEEEIKMYEELKKYGQVIANIDTKFFFDFAGSLINRIKELEQIEEAHRELNGELRKELQLKDKMIDLMIEVIANVTVPQEKCKQCIKEYFTKKASEK